MTDTHGVYKATELVPPVVPEPTYQVGQAVEVLREDLTDDWVHGHVKEVRGSHYDVVTTGGQVWCVPPRMVRSVEVVVAPGATSFTVAREWLRGLRDCLQDVKPSEPGQAGFIADAVNYISDLIEPPPKPKTALQVIAEGIVRSDYHHPPEDSQVEVQALMEGYQDQARSVLSALESAGFRVLHAGGKVGRDDG